MEPIEIERLKQQREEEYRRDMEEYRKDMEALERVHRMARHDQPGTATPGASEPPLNGNVPPKSTKPKKHKRRGKNLTTILKDVLTRLPSEEITVGLASDLLKKNGTPAKRGTVKTLIATLAKDGFLVLAKQGAGRTPSIFKMNQGESTSAGQNGTKPGPTRDIIELLRRNPGGMQSNLIADALADKIVSKSKDKRELIISLLKQLRAAGRVVAVDGLNRLAEEPK